MSMPTRVIHCSDCTFTAHLASMAITLEYTAADGQTAHSHRQPVWCPDCQAVTNGEALLSADGVAKRLAAHMAERPGLLARLFNTPLAQAHQAKLNNWQVLHTMATARRAPPRCLACFGTQAQPLATARHSCGGTFREGQPDPDAPRFHRRPHTIRLSAEGLPLA